MVLELNVVIYFINNRLTIDEVRPFYEFSDHENSIYIGKSDGENDTDVNIKYNLRNTVSEMTKY